MGMLQQYHGIIQSFTNEELPVSGVTAWYGDLVNSGVIRTTLANESVVSQWDDQSGNAYHLDGVDGQPWYLTGTTAISMGFGFLYNTSYDFLTGSTSRTIFTVNETTNQTLGHYYFFGDLSSGITNGYLELRNRGTSVPSRNTHYFGNGIVQWTESFPLNTRFLNTMTTSGTTVDTTNSRFNGVQDVLFDLVSGGTTINTEIGLTGGGGWIVDGVPTNPAGSNVSSYELIIYDRLLTPTEILSVESYLNTKYSIY